MIPYQRHNLGAYQYQGHPYQYQYQGPYQYNQYQGSRQVIPKHVNTQNPKDLELIEVQNFIKEFGRSIFIEFLSELEKKLQNKWSPTKKEFLFLDNYISEKYTENALNEFYDLVLEYHNLSQDELESMVSVPRYRFVLSNNLVLNDKLIEKYIKYLLNINDFNVFQHEITEIQKHYEIKINFDYVLKGFINLYRYRGHNELVTKEYITKVKIINNKKTPPTVSQVIEFINAGVKYGFIIDFIFYFVGIISETDKNIIMMKIDTEHRLYHKMLKGIFDGSIVNLLEF